MKLEQNAYHRLRGLYEIAVREYNDKCSQLHGKHSLSMCEAAELDWLRGRRDGIMTAFDAVVEELCEHGNDRSYHY